MSAHAHGQPGPLGACHGLAHRFHLRPGEAVLIRIENGLIAELQRIESGIPIDLGGSRTRAHHPGRPPVVAAQFEPRADGLRPVPRITHRVATGQTHTDFDAVGHRGTAIRCEHHRLVAPGREVPQRIVLAVGLQQAADRGFVLSGQCIGGALGRKKHHRRRHQRQRAEEAEEGIEEDVRPTDKEIRRGGGESADPVDRVGQPVPGLQGTREQLQQPQGQRDPGQVSGHQHAGRLEQRTTAHLGRELVVGRDQNGDRGDVDGQAHEFAQILEAAAIPLKQRRDIEADRDHQDDHQHPPGDALTCGQRAGHYCERKRPGEAGVGKVEQVVVDELPWHPGEVPDRRRDAGEQRGSGDHAEERARRRGNPTEAGPGPAHRDRHRPPGYSLIIGYLIAGYLITGYSVIIVARITRLAR